jgi:hypothetical protein
MQLTREAVFARLLQCTTQTLVACDQVHQQLRNTPQSGEQKRMIVQHLKDLMGSIKEDLDAIPFHQIDKVLSLDNLLEGLGQVGNCMHQLTLLSGTVGGLQLFPGDINGRYTSRFLQLPEYGRGNGELQIDLNQAIQELNAWYNQQELRPFRSSSTPFEDFSQNEVLSDRNTAIGTVIRTSRNRKLDISSLCTCEDTSRRNRSQLLSMGPVRLYSSSHRSNDRCPLHQPTGTTTYGLRIDVPWYLQHRFQILFGMTSSAGDYQFFRKLHTIRQVKPLSSPGFRDILEASDKLIQTNSRTTNWPHCFLNKNEVLTVLENLYAALAQGLKERHFLARDEDSKGVNMLHVSTCCCKSVRQPLTIISARTSCI